MFIVKDTNNVSKVEQIHIFFLMDFDRSDEKLDNRLVIAEGFCVCTLLYGSEDSISSKVLLESLRYLI